MVFKYFFKLSVEFYKMVRNNNETVIFVEAFGIT